MSVRIYVMCAGAWRRQKIIGFPLSYVFRQLLASDTSTEAHTQVLCKNSKYFSLLSCPSLPQIPDFNMKVTCEWLINWVLVILLYLFCISFVFIHWCYLQYFSKRGWRVCIGTHWGWFSSSCYFLSYKRILYSNNLIPFLPLLIFSSPRKEKCLSYPTGEFGWSNWPSVLEICLSAENRIHVLLSFVLLK